MASADAAPPRLPFFVYGTLLTGFANRNNLELACGAVDSCIPASLTGQLTMTHFAAGFPGLYEEGGATAEVQGELLHVNPARYDATLRALDSLEDFHGPGRSDNLYDRVERRVQPGGGGPPVLAWVYLCRMPRAPSSSQVVVPSAAPVPLYHWPSWRSKHRGGEPEAGDDWAAVMERSGGGSDFVLRPMLMEDAPAVSLLHGHYVTHSLATFLFTPLSLEVIQTAIRDRDVRGFPQLVAVLPTTGKLLGFAYVSGWRGDKPGYQWTVEDTLYVAPGYERRGIGRALLTGLLTAAAAAGFRLCIAGINVDEQGLGAGSVALHAIAGFTITARMPRVGWKHGRWVDNVFMQLEIGAGTSTSPEVGGGAGT